MESIIDSSKNLINLYGKINAEMHDKNLNSIVQKLNLNDFDKSIFYVRINEMLYNNTRQISKYKHYTKILRFIMQIFSIVLTFTLSISSFINNIYVNYFNLLLLFILTVSTNIFFQSKIGDKYLIYKRAYIKINHELWSYVMLINDYNIGNHKDNLNLFFSNVEKMYNLEFNEILDMIKQTNNSILSSAQNAMKSKLNDGNNKSNINNDNTENNDNSTSDNDDNSIQNVKV